MPTGNSANDSERFMKMTDSVGGAGFKRTPGML